MSVRRDELLAPEVLEHEGYAAWVRTLNGQQEERPESLEGDRAEISPRNTGFVQA